MPAGRKNKYDTHVQPRLDEIKWWCRDGRIDKEIAKLLGVGLSSFMLYKSKNAELRDSLKNNKEYADLNITDSLYRSANGEYIWEATEKTLYEVIEDELTVYRTSLIGVETKNFTGNTISVETCRMQRYIPPNPTADIFWTTNRMPGKWKRNRDNERNGEDGNGNAGELSAAIRESAALILATSGGDSNG